MGGEEHALTATEEACRVYVGNLLPKAKESHLSSKFSRFGTIHSVWIARRPPGFAFVRFASPEAAQRAVEACSDEGAMEILGKSVRVQMAGGKSGNQSMDESQKQVRNRRRDGDAVESWGRGRRSRSPSWRRGISERNRSRSRSRSRSRRRGSYSPRRSRPTSSYRSERHRYRPRERPRSRSRSGGRTRSRRRESRGSSWSTNRGRDTVRKKRRSFSRSSSRSRRQTKAES